MNNQIEPTPKQTEFITSEQKFSCFSGGFGSGKTIAGCLRSLLLSQFPGNFGLVGRLTYPELRDTTRKTFFEICPPEYYDEAAGGQWKPSENYLRLVNGSEIIFRHLDNVSEKELLSLNLGWFFIDQAEEVGERVFQILTSRLRLASVPNRYGFVVCNPEPSNWIDLKWRKPILENKPNPNHHFIESASYDNPYLPADYIPSLLATYPEEMVKRYIEGRWDVFENQIYHEFDYKMHSIVPFEIPKGWERIVGVDHGMVNPTAAIFAAVDYDGNIFVYDEYYSPGVVSDHARAIIEKTAGQEISFWLIDPSTQAKTREKDGMPWSVIEEYEDFGLYFTPANNEQLAGINRVKEFLKPQMSRRNPITKEIPSPRLFVFKNCVNLITEFPQYQWRKMRSLSQRNQKEQPRDFNDHALDALRYIIMSRFPAPIKRPIGTELVMPKDRMSNTLISKPFAPTDAGDEELGMFHGGMTEAEDSNDLTFGQEYGDS
ncbi:MAG: phage terminase large subunit [Patescibacteria group bacterium]